VILVVADARGAYFVGLDPSKRRYVGATLPAP
jgi:hypothetical protein